MNSNLTEQQKQLCNLLQQGLPVCPEPFGEIARSLNTDESAVLREVEMLRASGVIRRLGAIINYRALGMTSTLVAAHIPQPNLQKVVEAVNALENVSHNYLRRHHYNLWFTLLADSAEQIDGRFRNFQLVLMSIFTACRQSEYLSLMPALMPGEMSGRSGVLKNCRQKKMLR